MQWKIPPWGVAKINPLMWCIWECKVLLIAKLIILISTIFTHMQFYGYKCGCGIISQVHRISISLFITLSLTKHSNASGENTFSCRIKHERKCNVITIPLKSPDWHCHKVTWTYETFFIDLGLIFLCKNQIRMRKEEMNAGFLIFIFFSDRCSNIYRKR